MSGSVRSGTTSTARGSLGVAGGDGSTVGMAPAVSVTIGVHAGCVEVPAALSASPMTLDCRSKNRSIASQNVARVFNAWTRMPELQDQAQLSDAYTADFTIVRSLLTRARTYEKAVKAFEPYREIKEPNEGARRGMVEIARQARVRKIPAWVFVNNRLEGNAPTTIEEVADEIGPVSS